EHGKTGQHDDGAPTFTTLASFQLFLVDLRQWHVPVPHQHVPQGVLIAAALPGVFYVVRVDITGKFRVIPGVFRKFWQLTGGSIVTDRLVGNALWFGMRLSRHIINRSARGGLQSSGAISCQRLWWKFRVIFRS